MGCLLWEIHFACVSLSIKKEAVKHQTYPPDRYCISWWMKKVL
ncbi:hypothetical protein HMPREF0105_4247 [Bacteroides sp. 3_1_33FAA]|uniref:Uncharacterized protein n=1 Tax=Phocaeicola dorei DSM 17855 TaxID=483217 RepID=B6VVT4_9BACT|nr:hypothetical protein BACDOR_01392 [Phocaeicola dorei DSM 17855]EEZ19452.1 hypothetical protein HMPREF0105_4247 [Bacteroides sp. 3_1_33FAA]